MSNEGTVQRLWSDGTYAESAMGCTGPLILVSEKNEELARAILTQGGYIG